MDAYLMLIGPEVFAQGAVWPHLTPDLVSSAIVSVFFNSNFAIRYKFRFEILKGCIVLSSVDSTQQATISKALSCYLSAKEIWNSSCGINVVCSAGSFNGVVGTGSRYDEGRA